MLCFILSFKFFLTIYVVVFLYFKLRVFRAGAEIELNCRCIPRPIWEARKEKVENTNKGTKGFSPCFLHT